MGVGTIVVDANRVENQMITRDRVMRWIRRYLPCEVVSTVGELGGVAIAYAVTGSLVAGAVAATIGAFVGYYGMAYVNAVRWSYRDLPHESRERRLMTANLLALRSITVEFGIGETVDSLLVRPVTYSVIPQLLGNNVVFGWLIAKVIADVVFYACAILSYERFTTLVAARPPQNRPDTSDHDGRESFGLSILPASATKGS